MRAYWVLPNREQRDEILASDGETTLPLRQILDPKLRPDGFSHGIPTELLEKCGPKGLGDILFAQRFRGWNGDKQLFFISTPAGLDSSGRVVHLGLLLLLEPHERPRFDLSYSGLSPEDQGYASALLHRMTSTGRNDPWVQSVRDLVELPSDTGPATNVALERSVVPFHSRYVLGRRGFPKRAANRSRLSGIIIILLIVFAVVSAWLSVHAKNWVQACSNLGGGVTKRRLANLRRRAQPRCRLHADGGGLNAAGIGAHFHSQEAWLLACHRCGAFGKVCL